MPVPKSVSARNGDRSRLKNHGQFDQPSAEAIAELGQRLVTPVFLQLVEAGLTQCPPHVRIGCARSQSHLPNVPVLAGECSRNPARRIQHPKSNGRAQRNDARTELHIGFFEERQGVRFAVVNDLDLGW